MKTKHGGQRRCNTWKTNMKMKEKQGRESAILSERLNKLNSILSHRKFEGGVLEMNTEHSGTEEVNMRTIFHFV